MNIRSAARASAEVRVVASHQTEGHQSHALGNQFRVGVALVLVAALTYSTAGIFTKGVTAGSWEIIFWRGLFAAGFAVAWTAHRRELRANFVQMGRAGWAVGIIGALGTAAFIPAFKLTSIANVALIYAAAPLIAVALGWAAIGERPTFKTLLGSIGALCGVAIIVSGSAGTSSLTGDLLALWMTVAMAAIMVIYRKFPDTPSGGPAALQSLLLIPVALYVAAPFDVPPGEVLTLAAFGLLFAVSSVALAEGAKRIPSGHTALLSALETPLAGVLAFLFFLEVPGVAAVVGGTLILAAVLASVRNNTT